MVLRFVDGRNEKKGLVYASFEEVIDGVGISVFVSWILVFFLNCEEVI